nr:MAG TPA: hypothetical protein [Caudoviricetes sp.]
MVTNYSLPLFLYKFNLDTLLVSRLVLSKIKKKNKEEYSYSSLSRKINLS